MPAVQTAFDRALAWLLHGGHGWAGEGGTSADPTDHAARTQPFGAIHTNYGITQDTYTDWRLAQGDVPAPVAEIDLAEVSAIYFGLWRAAWCDQLAGKLGCADLALCVFDGVVQHGQGEAVRMWQRVARSTPDGVPGPLTLLMTDARRTHVGEPALCAAYLDRRHGFYEGLILRDPTQGRFRNGWRARLNALAATVGLAPLWTD